MAVIDLLLIGITVYLAVLLANLTSSAIQWQIANHRLRKELEKRKQKLKSFSLRFKQKLGLATKEVTPLPSSKCRDSQQE